jgi:CTP:molybdopterin cytidylyltransferase MocA
MPEQQIGAIILAAGVASRFFNDKLLASYRRKPLIYFALRAATLSSADPLRLVIAPGKLDAYAQHVRLLGRTVQIVIARLALKGLAYSLRAGLESMPEGLAGVVVLLADMPLVDSRLVDTLINAYTPADYAVVAKHNRRWGHPVLLGRDALVDAKSLEGDCGAKQLLLANRDRVRQITWDCRCLIDIDTEQALSKLNATKRVLIEC